MGKALREAYGEALVKYGEKDEKVVVLDADVSGSTMSARFGQAVPERFFNVGIAEANMTAMAAGFAATGYVPLQTHLPFSSPLWGWRRRVCSDHTPICPSNWREPTEGCPIPMTDPATTLWRISQP